MKHLLRQRPRISPRPHAPPVGSNRRHLAIVLGVALAALGVDVTAAWPSGSLALMMRSD